MCRVFSSETSVSTKNPEVEAASYSETSVTTKNPEVQAVSSFQAMVLLCSSERSRLTIKLSRTLAGSSPTHENPEDNEETLLTISNVVNSVVWTAVTVLFPAELRDSSLLPALGPTQLNE